MNEERAPLHAGRPARLRELGYDEIWLQNWLAAEPTRLGLGEVTILAQELTSARGGSLDILAAGDDGDTYYSIEVQLGEVDASHGFRVFDYWAQNRARSSPSSRWWIVRSKPSVSSGTVSCSTGFRWPRFVSQGSAAPGSSPIPASRASVNTPLSVAPIVLR